MRLVFLALLTLAAWRLLRRRHRLDQAYYWTPEWQAAEREAEADIAAGRVRHFTTVEDGLRWLTEPEPEDGYMAWSIQPS